jgi:CubicO group peptidase (beta-lactamase class C family)
MERMEALGSVLDAVVADRKIPSASLTVRADGREVFHGTRGVARLLPERPAAEDQPYDLASVTKALAASTVTAWALESGRIRLDDQVARWVPDVDPRIVVRHLLEHTSGYPAWRPLYEEAFDAWGLAETRRQLLRAARCTPLAAPPGEKHVYSDLGMIVLLQLLEAVGDDRFDQLLLRHVLQPAGVEDVRWGWPGAAATELCPVRGVVVEGTVHDLNCAALGGVSAHAGLFAPSRAVAELAERLMFAALDPDAHAGLPGRTLARLWASPGVGTHRGGWDSISEGYSSTGKYFPKDAVGHLGYTGTSVWIVPSKRVVVALLTNRVHPDDDKGRIKEVRPIVHDAVASALGWG